MTNSKSYIRKLKDVQDNFIFQENNIIDTYKPVGFSNIEKNGFSKSNVIDDLSTAAVIGVCEEEKIPSLGTINGYDVVTALPLENYTKNGVIYAYPQNPSEFMSSTMSNTLTTDRADSKTGIYRWTSRNIFKFTTNYYGYDRCIFKIPLVELANGIVINRENGLPHANTLKSYPYPEEIIMISQHFTSW